MPSSRITTLLLLLIGVGLLLVAISLNQSEIVEELASKGLKSVIAGIKLP